MKKQTSEKKSEAQNIEIPAGRKEANPITIETKGATNQIKIIAHEGSEVTIVENQTSKASEKTQENKVELVIEKNARVHYVTFQNLNEKTNQTTTRQAKVEKDATIEWSDFYLGGSVCKNQTTTKLTGEGSSVTNNAMFYGTERQNFDFQTNVLHEASHSTSKIIAKGALDNNARAGYRGVIDIQQNKEGCNGSQKEEFMLLSKNARIEAVPELEIANNNVKCTHATSITHVNLEKLFYLMSRGLDKKEAAKLVIAGFFTPLVEKTPEDIQEKIQTEIEKRIK